MSLVAEALASRLPPGYRWLPDTSLRVSPVDVRDMGLLIARPASLRRYVLPREVALAVEVAVTSHRRDLEEMRREYAAAGVPEYWVLDPEARILHVFRDLQNGDYASREALREGDPVLWNGEEMSVASLLPEP